MDVTDGPAPVCTHVLQVGGAARQAGAAPSSQSYGELGAPPDRRA
jgi:hypothetical protein